MLHPLLRSPPESRKRMNSLLCSGLKISRSGSLLFVCGGNDETHLRPKFCAYAKDKLDDFVIFQPEYAMIAYHSDQVGIQLDLGKFEELIADLSHAVILFPEAPGSFAETGYFCKTEGISAKTIFVPNSAFQKEDSFIMLGPARLFDANSKFTPQIQLDYENPNFDHVIERIKRVKHSQTKKIIDVQNMSGAFDLFCLIYEIFDILRIATIDDIIFVANSIMNGHAPKRRIKEVFTILIGSGFIKSIGEFGHYFCDNSKELVQIREGYVEIDFEVRMQVSETLGKAGTEFTKMVEELGSAS